MTVSDDESYDLMDVDEGGAAKKGNAASQTNGAGNTKKTSDQYQKVR